MFFDLKDLYQQVIVDHNKHPRNFREIESCSHDADGYNPLCGDQLHVYLKVNEHHLVQDISFKGTGCAISIASASLMTETMTGKTVDEAKVLFESFQQMVTSDITEEQDFSHLGKLAALAGVREFPSRIKCAILCWHTVQAALSGDQDAARTE
ncbi:MAG: SUF system NifU family Fe-S cluster assembly protein [Mariprofundaceae bacterium]|nr:SUF system NifU family Fe-S cluster assembly protein [Mariprofundaceae bacterium]